MNRKPPGPCFVYSILTAILAVTVAGFGLAVWHNPDFRAGALNLVMTCGIGLLLGTLAIAVMTSRRKP